MVVMLLSLRYFVECFIDLMLRSLLSGSCDLQVGFCLFKMCLCLLNFFVFHLILPVNRNVN